MISDAHTSQVTNSNQSQPLKAMLQIDEPTRNNNKYTTWQIATQMGTRHRMLGEAWHRIVLFVESMALLSRPDLDLMFIESGILEVSLNLFLKFEQCSMLHQSVANILVHGAYNFKNLNLFLENLLFYFTDETIHPCIYFYNVNS